MIFFLLGLSLAKNDLTTALWNQNWWRSENHTIDMYPFPSMNEKVYHVHVNGSSVRTESGGLPNAIRYFVKYLKSKTWEGVDCVLPLGLADKPPFYEYGRVLPFRMYPSGNRYTPTAYTAWGGELLQIIERKNVNTGSSVLGNTSTPIVFRGSSTGPRGQDISMNPRVQVASVSTKCKDVLDACITCIKLGSSRNKEEVLTKLLHAKYLSVANSTTLFPADKTSCPSINIYNSKMYPKVLVMNGNGAVDRFLSHLAAGQVVYRYLGGIYDEEWKSRETLYWSSQASFFESLLLSGVHFVPVHSFSCDSFRSLHAKYSPHYSKISEAARKFYEFVEAVFEDALWDFMIELSGLQKSIVGQIVDMHFNQVI